MPWEIKGQDLQFCQLLLNRPPFSRDTEVIDFVQNPKSSHHYEEYLQTFHYIVFAFLLCFMWLRLEIPVGQALYKHRQGTTSTPSSWQC